MTNFYEHMEASLLAASNLVLYWKTMFQANDSDEKQIDALQDIIEVTRRASRDGAMDEKRYILELTEEQLSDYKAHLSHPANIQDIPKPTKAEFGEDNNHPTIKPLKLMEWLVKLLSNEGDTVLDPFSGSGTTGVACKNLNREFIGIELDPDHVEFSRKRIEEREKEEDNEFIGYD